MEELMEKEEEKEEVLVKITNKTSWRKHLPLLFLFVEEEEDDTFHLLFWSGFEEQYEWYLQISSEKILSSVAS